jgi:hypothetical protein
VVLWECEDSVIGCRETDVGLEFVNFDVEDPSRLIPIARSEQGLLFWLLSWLIEDQDWQDEQATEMRLRDGAAAVGFRYFDEVNEFQQQFGGHTGYSDLLRARSLEIS